MTIHPTFHQIANGRRIRRSPSQQISSSRQVEKGPFSSASELTSVGGDADGRRGVNGIYHGSVSNAHFAFDRRWLRRQACSRARGLRRSSSDGEQTLQFFRKSLCASGSIKPLLATEIRRAAGGGSVGPQIRGEISAASRPSVRVWTRFRLSEPISHGHVNRRRM